MIATTTTETETGLYVPAVSTEDSVLDGALAYGAAGIYVGPVAAGTKNPGSVLGASWQQKTSCNRQVITSWLAGTDNGVFLHAGRSGLVIFDVDDPHKLHPDIRRAIDELRPPFQSTRPDQPGRGHYLFAVPSGRRLGNGLGTLTGGWGEVRGQNAAIVAVPTAHPSDGLYDWMRTGPVPVLPGYLADQLPDAQDAAQAATDRDVAAFFAEHQSVVPVDGLPPASTLLELQVRGIEQKFAAGESRHATMCGPTAQLMRESAAGLVDAKLAADTLASVFLAAVAEPASSARQGAPRTGAVAQNEWAGVLAWAVGQARAADPAATVSELREKFTLDGLVAQTKDAAAVDVVRSSGVPNTSDRQLRPDPEPLAPDEPRYPFVPGGTFILDASSDPEPLWGLAQEVLWPKGEAIIIAAPQGVGKTTLAQQAALGRIGLPEYAELLGYPIAPGQRRTLYLAMDRPRQAARSFRRMVGEPMRRELDERLVVWQGPPPLDLAKNPSLLLALCREADADTVVVDSLKDAAIGLSDDEVGAGYNRARQQAIAAGVEVLELHHNRKALGGVKAEKFTIDDLYGSTWLPSGAGSVLLLTGAPGDPIVGLHHVKQPSEPVGPFKVIHDHSTGRSQVWHSTDLVLLAGRPSGITSVEAASALFETDKPTPAERQKALRKLNTLAASGQLVKVAGDQARGVPDRFVRAVVRAA